VPLGQGILCAPVPPPQQVAPGSFMGATSRRPTFRWLVGGPINGARLQVCRDRACATRLIDTTVTGTSYTPTADLPAGLLWWRLFGRAGTNEGATASPVWQVHVTAVTAARSSAFGVVLDVNGDGYTDAAVGSTGLTAYVYHGSATGLGTSPARTYTGATGSEFGVTVSAAGDVNGDGYGDLIVGAPGIETAYLYYGSASGLGTRLTIPSPAVRSGCSGNFPAASSSRGRTPPPRSWLLLPHAARWAVQVDSISIGCGLVFAARLNCRRPAESFLVFFPSEPQARARSWGTIQTGLTDSF
jgi:hypothetical protein